MTNLNFLSAELKLGVFVCLIILFLIGVNTVIYGQCYSTTYSLVSDYTNEDLPLMMKKRLSKVAKQNKKIYTIVQSSTHSSEQVDSIVHICGGETIMVKPEVIIRETGQQSVGFFYNTNREQKYFSVQAPEYLDAWKITGPISYGNSDDRYFKAAKENSDDYVIFDSNTPVSHNLKLIQGIPGLVVEASIGVERMMLIEFKTSPCSDLNDRIKQLHEIEQVKIKREDFIDTRDFLNLSTDLISSEDFECVESF